MTTHQNEHTAQPADVPDRTGWTTRERAALTNLGCPNDDAAVAHLYEVAHRTGLSPFARQIYLVQRGRAGEKRWCVETSIDGFRVIAEKHGDYAGQDGPYWCGTDGQWTDVWLSNRPPAAAKVGIYRKGWQAPIYAVAKFDEYAAKKPNGDLTHMWDKMSALMIAKVAEALGLRRAFPLDLSGLYTSDEMQQSANPAPDAKATPPALPKKTHTPGEIDDRAQEHANQVSQTARSQDHMKTRWAAAVGEGVINGVVLAPDTGDAEALGTYLTRLARTLPEKTPAAEQEPTDGELHAALGSGHPDVEAHAENILAN